MSVKILLVDDHNLVTEGIARIINSNKNYSVVSQLTNGLDAIEYVKNKRFL